MSLNWWDKSCFKCTKNSQWKNKKLIPLNCHGHERRRISATSGWLPKLLGTFQCLLHHSYVERDKSKCNRDIKFFQQFPEVWLINKYGHGISCNLFKEIENQQSTRGTYGSRMQIQRGRVSLILVLKQDINRDVGREPWRQRRITWPPPLRLKWWGKRFYSTKRG